MAEKSKGLPLAVKVLRGALRNEEDEERLIDILESEIWELEKGQAGVLSALKIAYDSMPMELKRCFPYLSLFLKYIVLHRRVIVPLWMSHGPLQLARGKQVEEEDVTNVYNEDFSSTLVEEDASYVMHDLVHDLAKYVAQDEYLCVTNTMFDLKKSKNKVRHLTVNLKHNLGYTNITELPKSIESLKLLQSFSIRGIRVKRLSESIYNLYNLQTLNLSETYYCGVPRPIGNLVNLRHLFLYSSHVYLPSGIRNLTNLQTLLKFFVTRSGEYCGIGELHGLTKLHLYTLALGWGSDGLEYHDVNLEDEEEDYDNSKDGEEDDHEQGEIMEEQLLERL
ncbi:hypothetical protein ZIOFF_063737 [Zingiber officinale]|uniref:Disease resistance R13L4/SHOC-2-like LRR domain-containing protein n=1 Tax=Zingiber officinale TaxID=94328 RepID=A0A8J5F6Q4_ZINOF|nr:hypothetical protein ZIOFF_063737 [Zingiber officinale]